MKKMIIETKVSRRKVAKIIRTHYTEGAFSINIKRGQLYVFFSKHIDEKTVFVIAKDLCMEVVSMNARAILRY